MKSPLHAASGDCTTVNGSAPRADLGFIIIPDFVKRDPRLSPGAKVTYGQLKRFAGTDGKCFPAHSTIAREICSSVPAVKRFLKELRDASFIKWRRTSRGNSYTVCDRPPAYQEPPRQVLQIPSDSSLSSYQETERQLDFEPSDSSISSREVAHFRAIKSTSEENLLRPPPPKSLGSTKTGRAPDEPAGGGGGNLSVSDSDEPDGQELERAFARIERTAGVTLDGAVRKKIANALKAAGYSVAHLALLVSSDKLRGSTNPIGLLLVIAREIRVRSEGFTWPACLKCQDHGTIEDSACGCEAGLRHRAELERRRQVVEARKKFEREAQAAEAAKKAHAQTFKDLGICPGCEGVAGGCSSCNTTGIWHSIDDWRALGLCPWCSGTGTMGTRACVSCKGSGRTRSAFDDNGTAAGADARQA